MRDETRASVDVAQRVVGGASCKLLFDIYHQQITESKMIPNIDAYRAADNF